MAASPAYSQGTAFTYQGRLDYNGSPATGSYDMAFTLYATNSGGYAVAGPVTNTNTVVKNGLFTVTIDFGAGVFTGYNYWMEISVSPAGANSFVTLTPRQPVTPHPYAIMANSASNLLGTVPSSQIHGTISMDQLMSEVVTNRENGVTLGGVFTGTFIGDGSGLINLPSSQTTPAPQPLMSTVVTNTEAGVTLSGVFGGAFSGDGGGLTNLPSSPTAANFVYAYSLQTQAVVTVNTYQAITMDQNAQISGWKHTPGGVNFTNAQTGLYLVTYNAQTFQTGGNPNLTFRVVANGNEVAGSECQDNLNKNSIPFSVSKTFIARFNAGDVVQFQWAGSFNDNNNYWLMPNQGFGSTSSTPSFSCSIVRIQ
jgi:hypothetical protein